MRGGGRGRGRGGFGGKVVSSPEEEAAVKDNIVQQTDLDASLSRLSAVELGYLHDPFAHLFVSSEPQRRLPIMNRGTYVRSEAIDAFLKLFLLDRSSTKKQIISLGAGSDTRYFRLLHPEFLGNNAHGRTIRQNLVYHEYDLPNNVAKKKNLITNLSVLLNLVGGATISYDEEGIDSPRYHLHSLDLRTLDVEQPIPNSLLKVNTTVPTMIISECCLVYFTPESSDNIVQYFTKFLFPETTSVGLVLYEQINPNDAFGQVMTRNLAAREIFLESLQKYGSFSAQAARMKAYGFEDSAGADMNTLWDGIEEDEKMRVASREALDEIEEWVLLAGHYCVIWAWRGDNGAGSWAGWKDLKEFYGTKTTE